jgi:hypothetical protein
VDGKAESRGDPRDVQIDTSSFQGGAWLDTRLLSAMYRYSQDEFQVGV